MKMLYQGKHQSLGGGGSLLAHVNDKDACLRPKFHYPKIRISEISNPENRSTGPSNPKIEHKRLFY